MLPPDFDVINYAESTIPADFDVELYPEVFDSGNIQLLSFQSNSETFPVELDEAVLPEHVCTTDYDNSLVFGVINQNDSYGTTFYINECDNDFGDLEIPIDIGMFGSESEVFAVSSLQIQLAIYGAESDYFGISANAPAIQLGSFDAEIEANQISVSYIQVGSFESSYSAYPVEVFEHPNVALFCAESESNSTVPSTPIQIGAFGSTAETGQVSLFEHLTIGAFGSESSYQTGVLSAPIELTSFFSTSGGLDVEILTSFKIKIYESESETFEGTAWIPEYIPTSVGIVQSITPDIIYYQTCDIPFSIEDGVAISAVLEIAECDGTGGGGGGGTGGGGGGSEPVDELDIYALDKTGGIAERNSNAASDFYLEVRKFVLRVKPWQEFIEHEIRPNQLLDLSGISQVVYGRRDEYLAVMAACGLDEFCVPLKEQLIILPTEDTLRKIKRKTKFESISSYRKDNYPTWAD